MTRISTSYITTLNPASASDMRKLDAIRRTVSIGNKGAEKKYRVTVRGRDPIAKKTDKLRDGSFRTYGYDTCGNIVHGIVNARRIDVYVYERCA